MLFESVIDIYSAEHFTSQTKRNTKNRFESKVCDRSRIIEAGITASISGQDWFAGVDHTPYERMADLQMGATNHVFVDISGGRDFELHIVFNDEEPSFCAGNLDDILKDDLKKLLGDEDCTKITSQLQQAKKYLSFFLEAYRVLAGLFPGDRFEKVFGAQLKRFSSRTGTSMPLWNFAEENLGFTYLNQIAQHHWLTSYQDSVDHGSVTATEIFNMPTALYPH
jgi:hypothetical protein